MKEDSALLRIKSSERSIAHKLAEHLQREFVEWNVDCEYNRDSHDLSKLDSKRLNSWVTDCEENEKKKNGTTVYPDIIIHHRLTRENLLVMEIKKTSNRDDGSCDKKKLEAFIKEKELGYQYGLFINFKVGNSIGIEELKWYRTDEYE
ncbi:MAG: hypothetical protein HVN35_05890 [Methanobacteriaceae archaeon]|nr:hypothetical protein [Methanobacteriaceae archaeon]